jgi:hypothetical protein
MCGNWAEQGPIRFSPARKITGIEGKMAGIEGKTAAIEGKFGVLLRAVGINAAATIAILGVLLRHG